jgi:hypothetical protein
LFAQQTTNQNLEWEDFAYFFHLIDITWVTKKHVTQVFPHLTNLYS